MDPAKNGLNISHVEKNLRVKKHSPNDKVIALAGNPNVGKSTVFNQLTGLNQHTGNWPGKTVASAQGYIRHNDKGYILVDLPGCYSLMAHSAEEEVARDFCCFGKADAIIVVCDATCLERNINLVLQTLEITNNVIVCVNLLDEARKKKIYIDFERLSCMLGVPVIGTAARSKKGLDALLNILNEFDHIPKNPVSIIYNENIENFIGHLQPLIEKNCPELNSRWLAVKLLDSDESMLNSLSIYTDILDNKEIAKELEDIKTKIKNMNIGELQIKDDIACTLVAKSEEICRNIFTAKESKLDRRLDKLFTSKRTGFPIMILILMGIFWITISGANYPSQLISTVLFWIQEKLLVLLKYINLFLEKQENISP